VAVLALWEEPAPPRSACGANPVLTVDDFSTVVVSGWDVACDVTAELTGVVVTGWLAAALTAVTAGAFDDIVTAFPGWLNGDEPVENDGDRPGAPPVGRVEGAEENVSAEYGADEPGCIDIEWNSPAGDFTASAVPDSPFRCTLAVSVCCSLPVV
jgi:hypothetical protein